MVMAYSRGQEEEGLLFFSSSGWTMEHLSVKGLYGSTSQDKHSLTLRSTLLSRLGIGSEGATSNQTPGFTIQMHGSCLGQANGLEPVRAAVGVPQSCLSDCQTTTTVVERK